MAKKKKQNKWWLMIFILIIILGSYIIFTLWRQLSEQENARFAIYPAFGIPLPLGYAIHGIDVSSYQEYIYWPGIKNMQADDVKISFVFIKATEGLNNADKLFKRNWQSAKNAGLTRGAYHFFLATKSGRQQADNFIKNVKLERGDLPPVLDIENLYGVQPERMRREVQIWLSAVEDAYHVKPIIYSYADFYEKNLGDAFNEYPLWVAHYFETNKPPSDHKWVFWQHNDGGKVNGITTKVDFNVFSGDSAQFKQLLIR